MLELTPGARRFVITVCTLALVFIPVSLLVSDIQITTQLVLEMVGWSIACLVLERLSISLPTAAALSISTVTFIPMILFLPFPLPALLSAVIIIIIEVWERKPAVKVVFNAANYILSFGAAGIVWHSIASATPFEFETAARDILAIICTIVVFYAVNTGITNSIVAFQMERSMFYIWNTNDKPVLLPTISLSALGSILAVLWHHAPIWTVLTSLPILVTYLAFKHIRRLEDETREAIIAMADNIDARDSNTYQHSIRVAEYSQKIAERMKLGYELEDLIFLVARVHDLGKIGVPNDVLLKNGTLESAERQAMMLHPQIGAEILSKYRLFQKGADLVLHHHERWDGNGYPDGLAGKAIPMGARIIAVADTYDAMVSDRPYRKGSSPRTAMMELKRCMNTQFDPEVIEAFLSIIEEELAAAPQPTCKALDDEPDTRPLRAVREG